MGANDLFHLTSEALHLVLLLSGPCLAASIVVGFLVSVFQAATQIQDQALSFVPKLIAVGVALVLFGPWMGAELVRFTRALFVAAGP